MKGNDIVKLENIALIIGQLCGVRHFLKSEVVLGNKTRKVFLYTLVEYAT